MNLADMKILADHSQTMYELRDALLCAIAEVEQLTAANAELQEDIKGWEEMTQQILLSLRDQFAMAALRSIVVGCGPTGKDAKELANNAFALADAMLAARKAVRP